MAIHVRLNSLFAISASLAIAACSAGGPSMPASSYGESAGLRTRGFMPPTGIKNGVFIADDSTNSIEIFDPQTKLQIGSITGLNFPQDLATDKTADDLYEADTGAQQVLIFEAPYTRPAAVLSESGYYPDAVHVDTNGNLWVGNACAGSGGTCTGPGKVDEFVKAKGPPKTLPGGPYKDWFVTTDAAGNVWVDGKDSGGNPIIGYWPGGSGSFKPVAITMQLPGAIHFDNQGDLMLDDQRGAANGGSILDLFKPGQTTPYKQIALQTDGGQVISFALNLRESTIYAPEYTSGTTNIISYPAGVMKGTLPSTGSPNGVVVIPGPLP